MNAMLPPFDQTQNFPSHLYRFRSAKYLLGDKYQELDKQEIYFASKDELNDPMEGYYDIFWQGDEVVWQNLFKNYFLCLEMAFSSLVYCGEDEPIPKEAVFNAPYMEESKLSPEAKAKLTGLTNQFLANETIETLIGSLANRARTVRRNELYIYLRNIHPYAISLFIELYTRQGLIQPSQNPAEPNVAEKWLANIATQFALLYNAEHSNTLNHEKLDALYESSAMLFTQMDITNQLMGHYPIEKHSKMFVFVSFVEEYLEQLERLVYPEWYAACFMTESKCHNSALWGYYGDNHKGVCLKFKAGFNGEKSTLKLNGRPTGINCDGYVYGDTPHEFYIVNYSGKFIAIDFFRSLGQLPTPVLNKHWYRDNDGKVSICLEQKQSEESWRARYWKNFYAAATTKLEHWGHEDEYRLLFNSMSFNFPTKDSRKLKYDFNDLDGIILGMRTLDQDKIEIKNIVEKKCKESKRDHFEIYQAYYNHQQGRIDSYILWSIK